MPKDVPSQSNKPTSGGVDAVLVSPAKVAEVLGPAKVVINKGSEDGVRQGQRFLIYGKRQEIFDPDTNDSLGELEVVRGTGKVTHLQSRMATIGSDMTASAGKTIRRKRTPFAQLLGDEVIEEILPADTVAFVNTEKGDLAKPI